MEMTFNDYIMNPMGKGSAVMSASHREFSRMQYQHKFDNILLREKGKIDYRLFKDSKDNTYWIYAKIPSETCKEFYYDTLIKFYTDQSVKEGGRDLFKYKVKFFSNDPAFVYTYAYVFSHNNLFIEELTSKMSKIALNQAPVEKNPDESVGYVKSIYFVYLLMQNRNLNKLNIFEQQSDPLDPFYIKENVMEADMKIAEREEAGKAVSHKKKVRLDKSTYNKLRRMTGNAWTDKANDRVVVNTTRKVKKVSNSNVVKTTKKTKRK